MLYYIFRSSTEVLCPSLKGSPGASSNWIIHPSVLMSVRLCVMSSHLHIKYNIHVTLLPLGGIRFNKHILLILAKQLGYNGVITEILVTFLTYTLIVNVFIFVDFLNKRYVWFWLVNILSRVHGN